MAAYSSVPTFDSLTAVRAAAAGDRTAAPASDGESSIFVSDTRADSEALLASLPSGIGGGVRMVGDADTRKFRRDKLSRLFRLQRGTRCFRFTLLFLSVLIVFSGACLVVAVSRAAGCVETGSRAQCAAQPRRMRGRMCVATEATQPTRARYHTTAPARDTHVAGYLQFDLPAITVNQILPKLHINMAQ